MLGKGRTTQTINELIIDSLERTTTAGFLEANHFISNTTLRTRRTAGSTLGSRQLIPAIFREARGVIAATFLRRGPARRGAESTAARKRLVYLQNQESQVRRR